MPTPTITPLPPAPQRSDLPGIFRAKSDAFVAALVVFASQVAAVKVLAAASRRRVFMALLCDFSTASIVPPLRSCLIDAYGLSIWL